MKTFTFLLVILFPFFAAGQPKEAIVNLANTSAIEMYNIAKEWFAVSYKPGKVTIQVDDPTGQKLIGTGVKNITYTLQKSPTFVDVSYALSLQFRDGRFKYLLYVNSIKYENGYEMSFEDFKSLTTNEGWIAYRKNTGSKPQFSNKVLAATITDIYSLMNSNFDNIIADLTTHLKSGKKDANW